MGMGWTLLIAPLSSRIKATAKQGILGALYMRFSLREQSLNQDKVKVLVGGGIVGVK